MTPREQLCADILCTAAEGGIGYWCIWASTRRTKQHDYLELIGVRDCEDGTRFDNITRGVVELGLFRIAEGHIEISRYMVGLCKSALADPLSADIDANTADIIVQVGLFGEIVYG